MHDKSAFYTVHKLEPKGIIISFISCRSTGQLERGYISHTVGGGG